jgi:hypothetical protein
LSNTTKLNLFSVNSVASVARYSIFKGEKALIIPQTKIPPYALCPMPSLHVAPVFPPNIEQSLGYLSQATAPNRVHQLRKDILSPEGHLL